MFVYDVSVAASIYYAGLMLTFVTGVADAILYTRTSPLANDRFYCSYICAQPPLSGREKIVCLHVFGLLEIAPVSAHLYRCWCY